MVLHISLKKPETLESKALPDYECIQINMELLEVKKNYLINKELEIKKRKSYAHVFK